MTPEDWASPDRSSDVVRVDHPPAPEIQADVRDGAIEEDEVAALEVAAMDVVGRAVLLTGVVRQQDPSVLPRPHRESRAVEAPAARASVHVARSEYRLGRRDDLANVRAAPRARIGARANEDRGRREDADDGAMKDAKEQGGVLSGRGSGVRIGVGDDASTRVAALHRSTNVQRSSAAAPLLGAPVHGDAEPLQERLTRSR